MTEGFFFVSDNICPRLDHSWVYARPALRMRSNSALASNVPCAGSQLSSLQGDTPSRGSVPNLRAGFSFPLSPTVDCCAAGDALDAGGGEAAAASGYCPKAPKNIWISL